MSTEIKLGFFKKHFESPKEIYSFAFLSLLKKEVDKSKTYSKFQISTEGMKGLNLEMNKKDQYIAISYNLDTNEAFLSNVTDILTSSDSTAVSLVTKKGTFNNSKLYNALVKNNELNELKDNHFKLITTKDEFTINNHTVETVFLDVINDDNTNELKDELDSIEDAFYSNKQSDIEKEVSQVKEIIDDEFSNIEDYTGPEEDGL